MNTFPLGIIIPLWICLSLTALASENPNYPFPQHRNYGKDTILPNLYPRSWMDDDVREFYDVWKENYLVAAGEDTVGNPLFRIAFGPPGTENHRVTVSEGQGYGMMIIALMAGYETGAKTLFDGLWRFSRQHPSEIDPRLMAWRVSEDDPQEGDATSAFDGDADMAFALLLADRQWGSDGEIDYAEAARRMIEAIYQSEIGPQSKLPMLGDWVGVEPDGSKYNQYASRSSDLMFSHFKAFFYFTRQEDWLQVLEKARETASHLQEDFSPSTGLLPDFIVPQSNTNPAPKPAAPYFLESANDGHYYYNACRVPFRIGLDALLNRKAASKEIVEKISEWAERHHNGNPYAIAAGYDLDGNPVPDSDYFSTAFVAPLGVAAMNVPSQQAWLNAIYDAINQTHQDYYEDSLTLLSLLVMTGNFWDPTDYGNAFFYPIIPCTPPANPPPCCCL